MIFLFAGRMGSGKTSLSKPFASIHGFSWTSFGNVVRDEALRLGIIDPDRSSLQRIGQNLVVNEPHRFCSLVICSLKLHDIGHAVVDGLRHKYIYDIIINIKGADQVKLVYIDVADDVRHSRLQLNRGLSKSECLNYDNDPTENAVHLLRDAADEVILNGNSIGEGISQLEIWAAKFFI